MRRAVTSHDTVLPPEGDLTEAQAEELARRWLGEQAYVVDRDDPPQSPRLVALPRYYVGCGSHLYGNGDTWAAALEAARRMKEANEVVTDVDYDDSVRWNS
jgi:hypothetical protein